MTNCTQEALQFPAPKRRKTVHNMPGPSWPQVKIVFRGDSGFCRWRMLSWCERNRAAYIVGIAQNKPPERGYRLTPA